MPESSRIIPSTRVDASTRIIPAQGLPASLPLFSEDFEAYTVGANPSAVLWNNRTEVTTQTYSGSKVGLSIDNTFSRFPCVTASLFLADADFECDVIVPPNGGGEQFLFGVGMRGSGNFINPPIGAMMDIRFNAQIDFFDSATNQLQASHAYVFTSGQKYHLRMRVTGTLNVAWFITPPGGPELALGTGVMPGNSGFMYFFNYGTGDGLWDNFTVKAV